MKIVAGLAGLITGIALSTAVTAQDMPYQEQMMNRYEISEGVSEKVELDIDEFKDSLDFFLNHSINHPLPGTVVKDSTGTHIENRFINEYKVFAFMRQSEDEDREVIVIKGLENWLFYDSQDTSKHLMVPKSPILETYF